MNVQWEKTEKNTGVLTIEVEEEKVREALDVAFKKVRTQVNVPGFRKGKVPRPVFEARFGVEALYQDALDYLLPQSYPQAVEEAGIEPVDQPEIDVEQFEKGKPFIFKATVTVKPEVELGQYKDLEIEAQDFSVKEEDIEAELDQMRERAAALETIEGGAADGDFVKIDFKGFVDGEAFEGGEASDYNLQIGSGQFIPGFEEQLIGAKAGDEKDVNVTFPEEYHQESLAGKDALFKVTVHEVTRKNLPELDDEFAKDVSEFDTLAELKADIEKKVQERKEKEEEDYKRNAVVDKAVENATVDIPEVMVEHEIDHALRHFEQQLAMQGMNLDMYKQMLGSEDDALREQFKADAEKRVKSDLVLAAIAKAENVEVSEEEVEKEIEKRAELYNRGADEIRQLFPLESLKGDLQIQKVIELLVSNSQNAA